MSDANAVFLRALIKLLTEVFDGPPAAEAYVLNPGDAGLLRQLASIPAHIASTQPISGRSSIAAHVDHVHYGLTLLTRHFGGEPDPWAKADWNASWLHTEISEADWRTLRDRLRQEAEAWRNAVKVRHEWSELEAAAALASVAHTAYHLGAIRQILAVVQDSID